MAKPSQTLDLGIALDQINSDEAYEAIFERLAPVGATMVAKHETCRHDLGDTFPYRNHYDRPDNLCPALHHVLKLYVLRASLGFPSWEDNPEQYRIHCPDKTGTVWTLERITD